MKKTEEVIRRTYLRDATRDGRQLHELKTDPEVFSYVWEGIKHFEIRKNDRDFKSGDILHLRETKFTGEEMRGDPSPTGRPGAPLEYTGREILAKIGYIMHGPIYGLASGWVIMEIEKYHSITRS